MNEPCTWAVPRDMPPLTFEAMEAARNKLERDLQMREEARRFINMGRYLNVMLPPKYTVGMLEVAPLTPHERNVAAWNRMNERSQR